MRDIRLLLRPGRCCGRCRGRCRGPWHCNKCCYGRGAAAGAPMPGAFLRELLRLGTLLRRCRGPWHCNKCCYGRGAAAGDAKARSVPTRAATPWGAATGAAAGHGTASSAAMAGAQLRGMLWPGAFLRELLPWGAVAGCGDASSATVAEALPCAMMLLQVLCRGVISCVAVDATASRGVPVSAATAWGAG